MPVQIFCPGCDSSYTVADEKLGKIGRCKKCGKQFPLVPSSRFEAPPSTWKTEPETVPPQNEPKLPEAFGRYKVIRLLGQGGMGAVYLSQDTQLNRQVALKVTHLHAFTDRPEVRKRFFVEAQAAARFHHPNFCPIYDIGEADGVPYLTMAFIPGKTLAGSIEHKQGWPDRKAAEVVRELALALAKAHREGIIHRDLKPANIMIDGDGRMILMDFGLARWYDDLDSTLTPTGAIIGTPAYMPPEQAESKFDAVGPRSDVYSLGVILYELLTGRRPFEGPIAVVFSRILFVEPEPPSGLQPGIDPRLETICLKAMAKKPEDRHASMEEFAGVLTAFLSEPVLVPQAKPRPIKPRSEPLRGTKPPKPSLMDGSSDTPRESRSPVLIGVLAASMIAAVFLGVLYLASLKGRGNVVTLEPGKPTPAEDPTAVMSGPMGGGMPGGGGPGAVMSGPMSDGGMGGAVMSGPIGGGGPGAGMMGGGMPSGPMPGAGMGGGGMSGPIGGGGPGAGMGGAAMSGPTGGGGTGAGMSGPTGGGAPGAGMMGGSPGGGTGAGMGGPMGGATGNQPDELGRSSQTRLGNFTPLDDKLLTSTIGMKLKLIPAGEFLMGSDASDPDASDNEKANGKKHRVHITKPFYMGTTEVTVGQFRQFVEKTNFKTDAEKDGKGGYGWNDAKKTSEQDPKYTWRSPGFPQTDEHPVTNVSWNDAVAFCDWLSKEEGQTYRLPTEAEWEYCCRASQATRFCSGDDPETLAKVGNVADATVRESFPNWSWTIKARDGYVFTAPVGHFQANAFGLFDMHGNVWEWCADWYDEFYYAKLPSPALNPQNLTQAPLRVRRGGSWYIDPRSCRSAFRSRYAPSYRSVNLGFRVARVK